MVYLSIVMLVYQRVNLKAIHLASFFLIGKTWWALFPIVSEILSTKQMKSIIWVASRRDGDRCAERWVTLCLGKSQSPTKIHGKVCTLETLWFSIDIIGSMNFYWVPQIGVSKIHIRVMDCCYQSIDLSEASGSLCPQSEKTCVPT